MQSRIHKFANGTRLITVAMPHMFSASIGVWAGVGSRHESAKLNGVSHFLEHMLFKGTKRRSAAEISRKVEGLGGDLNAFTSEDHTCYYAKADGRHVGALADVLLDMYCTALFPADEVRREREVIQEEISMYRDQPSQRLEDLLAVALWPKHALGRPITGTEGTVGGLVRSDLIDYWKRHYNTGSTVIAATGNIDHDQLVKVLAPHVVRIPAGRNPVNRIPRAVAVEPMHGESLPVEQSHLGVAVETFGRRDPRRFALKLGSTILGGNMSSRLFQKLREEQGLCYSVSSEVDLFSDIGVLSVMLGLDPENQKRALKTVVDEVDRMCQRLVSARELCTARDYALGHMRMGLESTTNCMFYAGESVLGFGRPVRVAEVEEKVMAVTAGEIREVMQGVVGGQKLRGAVVGPEPDVDMLAGLL